ncbi:unnamed protein product [Tetraodon nigroviridis]|uniref:(spotted green pufferfish) hypothetical protein n=1 Tax=Tetraodon nigroviridis TaxID=99883 RepID=Q4SDZ1_TETNG|nr:unnamed protein product [Tetraodon nigroviridis]
MVVVRSKGCSVAMLILEGGGFDYCRPSRADSAIERATIRAHYLLANTLITTYPAVFAPEGPPTGSPPSRGGSPRRRRGENVQLQLKLKESHNMQLLHSSAKGGEEERYCHVFYPNKQPLIAEPKSKLPCSESWLTLDTQQHNVFLMLPQKIQPSKTARAGSMPPVVNKWSLTCRQRVRGRLSSSPGGCASFGFPSSAAGVNKKPDLTPESERRRQRHEQDELNELRPRRHKWTRIEDAFVWVIRNLCPVNGYATDIIGGEGKPGIKEELYGNRVFQKNAPLASRTLKPNVYNKALLSSVSKAAGALMKGCRCIQDRTCEQRTCVCKSPSDRCSQVAPFACTCSLSQNGDERRDADEGDDSRRGSKKHLAFCVSTMQMWRQFQVLKEANHSGAATHHATISWATHDSEQEGTTLWHRITLFLTWASVVCHKELRHGGQPDDPDRTSMQTNERRVCAYFCGMTCLNNPGYAAIQILI